MPEKVYSRLVDDVYVQNTYGIRFESGVTFSYEELKKFKSEPQEVVRMIYYIKKYFDGEVIQ